MSTKTRSRKLQRGAAALEFAILAPVLIMLLLGMIDFAMVFNGQAVVTNAARDAARAASLGKNYSATGTLITNETSALTNSSTISYTLCVGASTDATSWTCNGSYDSARAVASIARVTVSYKYSWITPLPNMIGQSNTTTITQTSYMRIETTS